MQVASAMHGAGRALRGVGSDGWLVADVVGRAGGAVGGLLGPAGRVSGGPLLPVGHDEVGLGVGVGPHVRVPAPVAAGTAHGTDQAIHRVWLGVEHAAAEAGVAGERGGLGRGGGVVGGATIHWAGGGGEEGVCGGGGSVGPRGGEGEDTASVGDGGGRGGVGGGGPRVVAAFLVDGAQCGDRAEAGGGREVALRCSFVQNLFLLLICRREREEGRRECYG